MKKCCTIQHEEIWHFCCLLLQCVKDGKGKGKAKAEPRTCLPPMCWTKTNIEENAEKHYKIQHIKRLWTTSACFIIRAWVSFRKKNRILLQVVHSLCSQARCWRCHLESERKPDIKPGVQVKRLFWNSFRVDSERNTVWNEIDREGSGSEETGCGKCKSSKARFRYRYLISSITWSKVAYSSAANSWAQGHRLTRSNWRCRWGCRASILDVRTPWSMSHEESLLQRGALEPIFEAKRHGQALFCDEPGKRFASPSPENTERHELRCVWCIWITFCISPMWQHV